MPCISLCLDPMYKYLWRLPGLVCCFSASCGFRLQVVQVSRRGNQYFPIIFQYFSILPVHILNLGTFSLCHVITTKIIACHLKLLFLIWRKQMMCLLRPLWSVTQRPGTRVSKVCIVRWFGSLRAWVELSRISLEFQNGGLWVGGWVGRGERKRENKKVLLFLSCSQRSPLKSYWMFLDRIFP